MIQHESDDNYDVWTDPEVKSDIFELVHGLAAGKRDQSVCAGKITRMRALEQRGDILTAVVDIRGAAYRVTLLRFVRDAAGEHVISHDVRSFLREQGRGWMPGEIGLPMWGGEFYYSIDPVSESWN